MTTEIEIQEQIITISVPAVSGSSFAPDFGTVQRIQLEPEDYPVYRGAYTVTPKEDAQTLATKNTIMTDNVTVKAIPYYETSNADGETVYIGKELI